MTLVGFKAQNHRQQVGKRGAKPEVDNLETPLGGRSRERPGRQDGDGGPCAREAWRYCSRVASDETQADA